MKKIVAFLLVFFSMAVPHVKAQEKTQEKTEPGYIVQYPALKLFPVRISRGQYNTIRDSIRLEMRKLNGSKPTEEEVYRKTDTVLNGIVCLAVTKAVCRETDEMIEEYRRVWFPTEEAQPRLQRSEPVLPTTNSVGW